MPCWAIIIVRHWLPSLPCKTCCLCGAPILRIPSSRGSSCHACTATRLCGHNLTCLSTWQTLHQSHPRYRLPSVFTVVEHVPKDCVESQEGDAKNQGVHLITAVTIGWVNIFGLRRVGLYCFSKPIKEIQGAFRWCLFCAFWFVAHYLSFCPIKNPHENMDANMMIWIRKSPIG